MATHGTSFFAELARAPGFPLRGDGIMLTLVASAWLFGTQFLSGCVPIAGLLVAAAGYGFFYGYLMRVVAAAASGDDELPAFQEITSWMDDGLVPAFQVFFLLALYFGGPLILMATPDMELVALCAAGLAVLLFPIGLLNLSLRTSILDPAFGWQLKAISSAPLAYLACVACMAGVVSLQWWTNAVVSDAQGDGLAAALALGGLGLVLSVYANLVNAFILGRFFYCNDLEV